MQRGWQRSWNAFVCSIDYVIYTFLHNLSKSMRNPPDTNLLPTSSPDASFLWWPLLPQCEIFIFFVSGSYTCGGTHLFFAMVHMPSCFSEWSGYAFISWPGITASTCIFINFPAYDMMIRYEATMFQKASFAKTMPLQPSCRQIGEHVPSLLHILNYETKTWEMYCLSVDLLWARISESSDAMPAREIRMVCSYNSYTSTQYFGSRPKS